jgi:hypothetical protein
MADNKKVREKPVAKGVTPKGVGQYVWLNKPDNYEGKESYKVNLRMTPEEAEPLIEKLTPHWEAAKEAGVKAFKANPKNKGKPVPNVTPLFSEVFDAEGNETGLVEFKFKRAASGIKKDGTPWHIKPDLFSSTGKPWDDRAIYSGSVLKIGYEAFPYATPQAIGLSLRLMAAQVVVLKSGSRDADAYGFGNEGGDEDEGDDSAAPGATDDGGEAGDGDEF